MVCPVLFPSSGVSVLFCHARGCQQKSFVAVRGWDTKLRVSCPQSHLLFLFWSFSHWRGKKTPNQLGCRPQSPTSLALQSRTCHQQSKFVVGPNLQNKFMKRQRKSLKNLLPFHCSATPWCPTGANTVGYLIPTYSLSLRVSLKTIKTRFLLWDRHGQTCGPEANFFLYPSAFFLVIRALRVPSLSLQPFPLEKHMGSS